MSEDTPQATPPEVPPMSGTPVEIREHPIGEVSTSPEFTSDKDFDAMTKRASYRVIRSTMLESDLAKSEEAHEKTATELTEQKAMFEVLVAKNTELDEELEKLRESSIVSFKKVANLREENAELTERLIEVEKEARLATVDYRTDILNERGLERMYDELVKRPTIRRDGEKVSHIDSLLFIDGDEFKIVNDKLGQDGGNEVLKIIAKTMRLNTRETDIVGRWGGDEFIILLPDTDIEGARLVAEIIREAIENLQGMPMIVTVSIGIDAIDPKKKLTKTAIKANAAMKKAKSLGRNKVISVNDFDEEAA